MAITRFTYQNPWQALDQLTNRLGFFHDDPPAGANGGTWLPAVNVEESGDELVLTAEVPGMNREDIDVLLENNVLTVRGERTEERKEGEEGRRYHVWERRYGSFQRSFTLPRTVRPEDIAADYKDGVLTVRMPKAADAKSRKIQIGAGAGTSHVASIG